MIMESTAVQSIWVSVLVQVVRDLTRPGQRQSGETAMAERWIGTYPTRDFREVCALAELEPTASHAWFRRLCDTPFEERRAMVPTFETTLETVFEARSAAVALAVKTRKRRAA